MRAIGLNGKAFIPLLSAYACAVPAIMSTRTIENKREIALIRDRVLPVVRLHRKFSVKPDSEDPLESLLIIAESAEAEFCLMVDKLKYISATQNYRDFFAL